MAGESIGWGAEFWLSTDATEANLQELAGVFELSPPNEQADDVEITHFKSAGRKREYITGLTETGEGTISMNFVAGSATDLLVQAAKAAGDTRAYRIVIPNAAGEPAWQIDGFCYVKGYERGIPVDDRMTATVTVKFTGDTTEAAAA